MKQNITKQLNNLRDSFGEPIAVALIVDHKEISIRKARKLGPHFVEGKQESSKIEDFNEEELDEVNMEALPSMEKAPKEKTTYMG
jgi:hypothetical protein